ncbi:MAG: ATP-binding protein [Pseudomonadota bacterium]
MGTDLAKVMELQPDGKTLLVKAGVGWDDDIVGQKILKAERGSSEGYALATGEPVISNDIEREERFRYADFIKAHGVKALANVVIGRPDGSAYGILQVDSRAPHDFGEREISFLQGYANLLGAAIDRLMKTQKLRETQSALSESEAALHQSQKVEAIGQLTGGVAHDFNNLLTVIRSSADFLRKPDLAEARRQRYVTAIIETADRAAALTKQLLAFARRQPLSPEVFDVGDSLVTVIGLLKPLLGSRITIEHEPCDPPCAIRADRAQFETALVNLAINARDAMGGEGHLRIKAEARVGLPAVRGHAAAPGDFISISVRDTGTGIEPEVIGKIFEPFFTTKPAGLGTGLGLSQVMGFAKQSGGEIDVLSRPGAGATFFVYLPQHVAGPDGPVEVGPPPADPRRPDARILVVEDNSVVGQFATETLGELGYRTTWAPNAAAALAILADEGERFDLVFSDVVMPGMNGLEMARLIRKDRPDLPVVLTSGYSQTLAQEGTDGFELVQKPYSVDALGPILQHALATARSGVR